MKITSVVLNLFFGVVAFSTVSLTYNNCASRPFESQYIGSVTNPSMVPTTPGTQGIVKSCTGEFPTNASLCYGDDQGLAQNFARILSNSCTGSQKCEFICNAGFNFENGVCAVPQVVACANPDPCQNGQNCTLTTGTPTQIGQAWTKNATTCGFRCNIGFEGNFCERATAPTYTCQGTEPSNSLLCASDEADLTSNISRAVFGVCSAERKCEHTCKPGFNNINGVCIQQLNNSCAPMVPCVVPTQCTTTTGNPTTQNQGWVKNAAHCGFSCADWFEGALCETEKTPIYSCTGTAPANAVLCSGDDQNLVANIARRVFSSCSPETKCQYVCDSGFNSVNGVCVRQTFSCNSTLPCVNGLNCQINNGTPSQVNQVWVKGAAHCGFSCLEGYDGALCERGARPPVVSCANAQNTLPLVTHWSETTKRFQEGATDQMVLHNPNRNQTRYFYNYGLLPLVDNYIADTYEYRKISDSEYQNWANGECQLSGISIEHRKPSSYSDWTVAKSAVIGNRGSLQMLYGLVIGKSLVNVILPPGWNPTDPPGKYPIVVSGHYDLANHLIVPNNQMIQTLSYAYKNLSAPAIGVIWNGAGSIGSRTVPASARLEFNSIMQRIKNIFGGDAERIFIFGGSRGGLTALSMSANPESLPYRVVACYAAVPPADFPFVAGLTGSTVPLLLGAAEWSIGLLDTWKKDFKYSVNNNLKDYTRNEAHLAVLAGTKDKSIFESTINLSSPYIINSIKSRSPRLFLELGSHDFIVPWVDQFKFYNKLKQSGVQFESRINYLAGHHSDSSGPNATASSTLFAGIVKKISDGQYSAIFQHGRHSQFMNDYVSRTLKPIDSAVRFTLEVPRLQSNNVTGHIIMTGIPRTKFKFEFTVNGASVDSNGKPFISEGELDDDGVLISGLAPLTLGVYVITKLDILKPQTTVWKNIGFMNGTTNWERGRLQIDVLDETAAGVNGDFTAQDLERAIMRNVTGENLDQGTNGFQNVNYGIAEE